MDSLEIAMLSPDDVLQRMSLEPAVLILDVRNDDEWEARHIAGATLIPMGALRYRLGELDPQRETIVVCEHGVRSLTVARYLTTQANFTRVGNMVGGMSAWNGPIVTGPEA